jgi:uncharacterized protein YggT (Ycf19 family)
MPLIDLILNIVGLLFWFNWRAVRFDPLAKTTPATLMGTLRRAEPSRFRRWHLLAALAGLLLLRALLYWQIGSAVNWNGTVELGAISISFRSDFFGRTLLFSLCSFGFAMAVFFLWLLFLSLLKPPGGEGDSLQRLVRLQLGRLDKWRGWAKAALPFVGASCLWWLVSWPLAHWALVPRPVSPVHRLEQAVVIGFGSYLAWKYLIVGILVLHVVNSYVYFGNHPLWTQMKGVARQLLRTISRVPLRIGKVDFAPVLLIALVFFLSRLLETGLTALYGKLPVEF